MEPIKYRKVYDRTGAFEHLELIQSGNVIKLSLADGGTHYSGYRWHEVKDVVDEFQRNATKEAQDAAGGNDGRYVKTITKQWEKTSGK